MSGERKSKKNVSRGATVTKHFFLPKDSLKKVRKKSENQSNIGFQWSYVFVQAFFPKTY